MPRAIRNGDCIRIPHGRIGRVRGKVIRKYKVRFRRMTSNTHQFHISWATELKSIDARKVG